MQTLFEAIYDRFLNDTDLHNSVTDMYNTVAPADAKFPYIVFTLVNDNQDFDSHNLIEDVLLQFSIFSKAQSVKEITDIFEYLKGNTAAGTGFDFYELLVDNYDTLVLKRETANFTKVENIWQCTVTYRCLLSYTGTVATEIPCTGASNLYTLMGI